MCAAAPSSQLHVNASALVASMHTRAAALSQTRTRARTGNITTLRDAPAAAGVDVPAALAKFW